MKKLLICTLAFVTMFGTTTFAAENNDYIDDYYKSLSPETCIKDLYYCLSLLKASDKIDSMSNADIHNAMNLCIDEYEYDGFCNLFANTPSTHEGAKEDDICYGVLETYITDVLNNVKNLNISQETALESFIYKCKDMQNLDNKILELLKAGKTYDDEEITKNINELKNFFKKDISEILSVVKEIAEQNNVNVEEDFSIFPINTGTGDEATY